MRPELLHSLFSPVTRVRGIGPAIAASIARLTPPPSGHTQPIQRDLLFHLPIGCIDRRRTYPLREAPPGIVATFTVRVEAHYPPPRGRGQRKPYKVRCSNATGEIMLVFFHAREDYLLKMLPVSAERVISGATERFDGILQMSHPDIIAPVADLAQVQRVEPVYPLTEGLTNRRLSAIIAHILEQAPELPEWVASSVMQKYNWKSWKATLKDVHAPQSEEDILPGAPTRLRLAFDEALAGQLHLGRLRQSMQVRAGAAIPVSPLKDALIARLPFALTKGQLHVLAEIEADMASGKRMARLLQGDVGSGKTVVALISALHAVAAGYQAALMVPTELVALQHFEVFRRLCEGLPVNIALLTGGLKGEKREILLRNIVNGEAQIIVGTHALFQEDVLFHRLALLIVDEQHRFGVAQRQALAQKAGMKETAPHLLQMTATPIPRSLTMTAYGDMDCSLLLEKPAGRTPVDTRVIPLSRMDEVIARMRPAMERGEKIYWICPMIEETDLTYGDAPAAESRFTTFSTMFPNMVGLVHGRMKPEERDQHMQRFAAGQCRLLVATTVVEVGVDVPDATIMVIEQAERFGLSQLHQLRGRVGRGDKPSFCVLLYSDAAGDEARARLSTLRESQDGLQIAEADLRIRGGGDLLGTRQSGMPAFRFLSLAQHQELIVEARAQAHAVLAQDTKLEKPESNALQILLALFGYP